MFSDESRSKRQLYSLSFGFSQTELSPTQHFLMHHRRHFLCLERELYSGLLSAQVQLRS